MRAVKSESTDIVSLEQMEDGDLAEVVRWHTSVVVPGQIVLRHKDTIIVLGGDQGDSYTTIFEGTKAQTENKVRILKAGDSITLV